MKRTKTYSLIDTKLSEDEMDIFRVVKWLKSQGIIIKENSDLNGNILDFQVNFKGEILTVNLDTWEAILLHILIKLDNLS